VSEYLVAGNAAPTARARLDDHLPTARPPALSVRHQRRRMGRTRPARAWRLPGPGEIPHGSGGPGCGGMRGGAQDPDSTLAGSLIGSSRSMASAVVTPRHASGNCTTRNHDAVTGGGLVHSGTSTAARSRSGGQTGRYQPGRGLSAPATSPRTPASASTSASTRSRNASPSWSPTATRRASPTATRSVSRRDSRATHGLCGRGDFDVLFYGGPYLAEFEPHSHSSGPFRDATGRTPPHALTGSPLSRRSAPR
jgi:hypothetical protein